MRAYLPDYEVEVPKTLSEALKILSKGNCKPLAGGTDLMVLLEAGVLPAGKFISIPHLKELKGISENKEWIKIGALTTYSEIQSHKILQKEFPNLVLAAQNTGAVAIQNRGTIGGNIANASPAADSPPALLSYDAEIELVSAQGSRRVPYSSFHTGYKKSLLKPEDLIQSLWLPRKFQKHSHYYRKVGARKMQAISKIVMSAVALVKTKEIHCIQIGLGSVAPEPIRALNAEKYLLGKKLKEISLDHALEQLQRDIAPIDDIRSTKVYRNKVTANLLSEFLESLS